MILKKLYRREFFTALMSGHWMELKYYWKKWHAHR